MSIEKINFDNIVTHYNKTTNDYLNVIKQYNININYKDNDVLKKYNQTLNAFTKINYQNGIIENTNYMKIYLGGKRGGFAIVNNEDYESVSQYKWHQNDDGYAKGMINGKLVVMHRFLMNPSQSQIIDHIHRNKLDNKTENLKITTVNDNTKNKSKAKNTSSQYKNVYFDKKKKKYVARITNDNKPIYISSHKNEIDAAIAVDMHIVHNNLEHNLNFPNDRDKYQNTEYITSKRNIKSKYYGVGKSKNAFVSRISYNNIINNVYYGNNEIEGAKAYDAFIVKYNMPGKKLNFPEEHPTYNPNWVIKILCEKQGNNTVKLLIDDTGKYNPLIDEEDYEKIKYYNCYVEKDGYVKVSNYNGNIVSLHRLLMNFPEPHLVVDHKNGTKCDNTKKNLEVTTIKKNNQNMKKRKNCTSIYIGVRLDKRKGMKNKKWRVTQTINGKKTNLGQFIIEEHAGRKRDLYILETHPHENYKLNFVWTPNEITTWRETLKMTKL